MQLCLSLMIIKLCVRWYEPCLLWALARIMGYYRQGKICVESELLIQDFYSSIQIKNRSEFILKFILNLALKINNGNRTNKSAINAKIIRVITKSSDRVVGG